MKANIFNKWAMSNVQPWIKSVISTIHQIFLTQPRLSSLVFNEEGILNLMYNQISPYFDSVFSKFQCGFRKGFNAQHCLLTMVEKWRKTLDEGGETGAVLTDLSKAFDVLITIYL